MGAHASQLNKEERWKLVWYVQKLQGKDLEAMNSGNGSDSTVVDEPILEDVDQPEEAPLVIEAGH